MDNNNADDWEEQMLKDMAKMFSEMGMPIDIEILRNMLSQVREQFQKLGIDPEKLSNQDMKIDINGDSEEFRRTMESMLNGSDGLSELFRNMGVNVQVNNPTPVVDAEIPVYISPAATVPAANLAVPSAISPFLCLAASSSLKNASSLSPNFVLLLI